MSVVVDQWKRLYGNGWEKQLNMIGNLIYMKRTWDLEEWNYEDRYKRETNVSKPNGRDEGSENKERKKLRSEVPDDRIQVVS